MEKFKFYNGPERRSGSDRRTGDDRRHSLGIGAGQLILPIFMDLLPSEMEAKQLTLPLFTHS